MQNIFKELSHLSFPDIVNGALGALLGVNTFAFRYQVDETQDSKKPPFGVKTMPDWTLAGKYELSHKTMNANKPQRQPFVYHLYRKHIKEEPLDELFQIFWKKKEAEGASSQQLAFLGIL